MSYINKIQGQELEGTVNDNTRPVETGGINAGGFYPEPSTNQPSLEYKAKSVSRYDSAGNLMTRGAISTDEGSFRDDFLGSSLDTAITGTLTFTNGSDVVTGSGTSFISELGRYNYIKLDADLDSAWVRVISIINDGELVLANTYTGTGGSGASSKSTWRRTEDTGTTLSVSNSLLTLSSGTTSGSFCLISKEVDYGPLSYTFRAKINQRISNQTISIGLQDSEVSPNLRTTIVFDGTDNSKIKFVTSQSSLSQDTETTNTTLPNSILTSDYATYRVDMNPDVVNLFVNDILYATHKVHVPGPYDVMDFISYIENTGVPSSSTTVTIDSIFVSNYNSNLVTTNIPIKTGVPSGNESFIPVAIKPSKKFRASFSDVQSGATTNSFTTLQTGSGMAVNQSAGNLVITSGTTANSETVLRSNVSFNQSWLLKYQSILSQRIANNNFFIELVDVIGDGLTLTVNSSTSITVAIPNNPFSSLNIGQFCNIGVISGVASAIPGRYAIASISGNNVNFTVASWPGSGSGTCSVFGWNFCKSQYTSTTATNSTFDCQRNGWNSGDTTVTVNTTASPGHMVHISNEDAVVGYSDQLVASATGSQVSPRATRVVAIPDQETTLYLQVRILNGTSAPATTTTWTIGLVSMENYAPNSVSISNIKPQSVATQQNVIVSNSVTVGTHAVTQSGTWADDLTVTNNTDISSAAVTTTAAEATITQGNKSSVSLFINVTAASGTNPTCDWILQESLDSGTTWIDTYHIPRFTTTGTYTTPRIRLIGNRYRLNRTISGTTPSFTRAVISNRYAGDARHVRSFYNRTIDPNTLNSVTSSWNIEGCKQCSIYAVLAAGGTAGVFTLQISDDGTNWSDTTTTITPVVAATVNVLNILINARFARLRTSTVGVGSTLTYVSIYAQE